MPSEVVSKSSLLLLLGREKNVGSKLLLCMAHISSSSFDLSASTPQEVKWASSKPDCKEDFHVLSSPPTHSFFQGTFVRKQLKHVVLGLSFLWLRKETPRKHSGQGHPKV